MQNKMGPTLATPSAKAHERITGRWNQDIKVETSQQWFFYYCKMALGSPVPYLFLIFVIGLFTNRALLEVSAWSVVGLTSLYIAADYWGQGKEFSPFRLGADGALIGYVFVGLIGVLFFLPWSDYLLGFGGLRWILLAYLLAYTFEIFPDLNRIFTTVVLCGVILAVYGIVQHFTGFDLITAHTLEFAPAREHAYFCIRGFFDSPEIFGTLMAMLLPLPACAYLFIESRSSLALRWTFLPLCLILTTALFWTYRPGIWLAGGAGLMVLIFLQLRRQFTLLASLAGLIAAILLIAYASPQKFLHQLADSEKTRAVAQRQELNKQIAVFSNNMWLGAGLESKETHAFTRETGNIYFQVLAETGLIGLLFYLAFILGFLLRSYQLWREIPPSHFWHRTLASGVLGGQVAFHVAGLYWPTLREPHVTYLLVLYLAAVAYVTQNYDSGLVTDDYSL
jgi:O-antigen ligase